MSVPDILAHSHIAHRGLLAEFKDVPGAGGLYLSHRFRTMVSQQRLTHRRLLSASNHELLSELGYADDVIAQFRQGGRDMTDGGLVADSHH